MLNKAIDLTGFFESLDEPSEHQQKQACILLFVFALWLSFILHFFLLLLLFPYLNTGTHQSTERKLLQLQLVENDEISKADETGKAVSSEVGLEPLDHLPLKTPHIPSQLIDKEQKSGSQVDIDFASDSRSLPPLSENLTVHTRATIFDPRLREKFYRSHSDSTSALPSSNTKILNMQFYELGKGECLREMNGGYGISDRGSEEFLLLNVRKVTCPGNHAESEGEALIRSLRSSLLK